MAKKKINPWLIAGVALGGYLLYKNFIAKPPAAQLPATAYLPGTSVTTPNPGSVTTAVLTAAPSLISSLTSLFKPASGGPVSTPAGSSYDPATSSYYLAGAKQVGCPYIN